MKRLLVVIDMQNDFIDGALGTAEALSIVAGVKDKIQKALSLGDTVVFTMDTHTSEYLSTKEGVHLPVVHCVEGTDGWQIHQDLLPYADRIFIKHGFGSTDLVDFVRTGDFDQVELVGLCTDICVVTNALMLKGSLPHLDLRVDASCCAGVTPQSHEAALLTMKMCQIDV